MVLPQSALAVAVVVVACEETVRITFRGCL
jgi:hypothetical protein